MTQAKSTEKVVQEIRRKTRRRFSAEEKICIVLDGLRRTRNEIERYSGEDLKRQGLKFSDVANPEPIFYVATTPPALNAARHSHDRPLGPAR